MIKASRGKLILLLLLLAPLSACSFGPKLAVAPSSYIYPVDPSADAAPVEAATPETGDAPEAVAVDPVAQRDALAKAFAENAGALRGLDWKTRTRLQIAGQLALLIEHRVKHDENGDQTRTLARTGRPSATRMGGDLAQADDETAALTETISQLVAAYTVPSAGMMERFLKDAAEKSDDQTEPGTLCLAGSGFLMPEDQVVVWVKPKSGELKRLQFDTLLDGAPVSGVVKYRDLPDGPFYPAHTQVYVPGRDVQMSVEQYGYSLRR